LNQHINLTILDPKKIKPNMDGGATEKGAEESNEL
jgi:hypothetical protein